MPSACTVAFLDNNAHDKVVLRAIERCHAGCEGTLLSLGSSAMTHDVHVTPIYDEDAIRGS